MVKKNLTILSHREEWIAIDFFRLICALLVVSIHLPIFKSINLEVSYYFNHVVCRIAVPFFFISSGFFVAEKLESNSAYTYIKRILMMYLLYTIIYVPQYLYRTLPDEVDIHYVLDTCRKFFLVGSYTQLWYLVALVFSILVLKLMVDRLKFSERALIWFGIILYVIGVVGNSYKNALVELNIQFIDLYYDIFSTTRNGLFFGIPFVIAGVLIRKNSYRIKNNGYFKWSVIFFIGMFVEAWFIHNYFDTGGKDMMFFTLPATVSIFLMVCFIEVNKERLQIIAKKCRNYSVTIFGLHLFIYFYVNGILARCGYLMEDNTVTRYIIVVSLTIIASMIVIRLSKCKGFKWMKNMY